VWMAAVLIPVQIFIGDLHGLNTLKHQPQKISAIEAVWETERGADLVLFGIPDEKNKTTHLAIKVPNAASLILTREIDGELKGLNEFEGKHPPVKPVFYAFRIMVGVGVAMLLISWWGAWLLWRKRESIWLKRSLVAMTFSGWVALLAGWYVTEIGRQPWLVHGVLMTRDAASSVAAPMIGTSLLLYLALYAFLIYAYISVLFYLARKSDQAKQAAEITAEVQHA
jgi:cytochrome bd ubiquinol oxidase subunit I